MGLEISYIPIIFFIDMYTYMSYYKYTSVVIVFYLLYR